VPAPKARGPWRQAAICCAVGVCAVAILRWAVTPPERASTPYRLTQLIPETPTDFLLLGHRVNLNTATPAILETLPGIGPALAQRIVHHRQTHGDFPTGHAVRNVSGIGPVLWQRIASDVTVAIAPDGESGDETSAAQ
jgi:competence ComEA-like helix-hairpin-helix protein